jgi:hypothetical protein
MKRTTVLIAAGIAAVIVAQVICTLYLRRAMTSSDEIFSDHVQQMLYDGAVVRIDFGRGRVANPEARSPGPTQDLTAARIVITADGAEQLYQNLARLRAAAHARASPPPPQQSGGTRDHAM